MIKMIKNLFYLITSLIFLITIIFFYFSEENIKSTNKNRSFYLLSLNNKIEDLPILENDTQNIIIYSNDVENYKKNKKKYSFESLIN
mgnify:CR=1 FL=1